MKAKTRPTKEMLLPRTISKDRTLSSERTVGSRLLRLKLGKPCRRAVYRVSMILQKINKHFAVLLI
jgi:hypothetical protein